MKLKTMFVMLSLTVMSACVYADKQTHERLEQLQAQVASAPELSSEAMIPAASPDTNKKDRIPEIKPIEMQSSFANSAIIVSNILSRYEYDKQKLDLAMSQKIFEAYFKKLDPQKMYFLNEDIEKFEPWKDSLSQMLLNGQLTVPFDIFRLYRDRVKQRYDYVLSVIDGSFDFTIDESFTVDRKKAKWAQTDEEINDIWRRRIKNDFLRLKIAGTANEKIRQTLRKRYINNRNQILQFNSEDVAELYLNAYADSTDPHTTYYSPSSAKNFDVQLSLSVEGIGAVLQKRDEYGQIREVVAGGPAARSGQIHPGDRIVAVGQGESGPMEDVVDWRLDDIVKKIRGKRGSVVRIEVIPAEGGLDGKHRTIRIVREKVTMEDQAARSKIYESKLDDKTYKIGIITVPSFYEDFDGRIGGNKNYKSVSRDVKGFLEQYKKEGVEAVVLDLRNDGGGSLTEAANLSGLFIGENRPVVQVRNASGSVSNVKSRAIGGDAGQLLDSEQVWDTPVVVIVNRISASASEIFAAAIQDYSRGVVVGDPTWGKGTVQTFRELNDFLSRPSLGGDGLGALKWTVQKFFRVNGSSTQVKGVTPDILYPNSYDSKELGESSYENAMPWSEIPPAQYHTFSSLKQIIPELRKRHSERIKHSGSWQLMADETAYARQLSARKSYHLSLTKRQEERDEMNRQYKSFEARRKELGDSDVATFTLDDGLAFGEGNLKDELEKEKKLKENIDTIARESANIAADMVQMKIQP